MIHSVLTLAPVLAQLLLQVDMGTLQMQEPISSEQEGSPLYQNGSMTMSSSELGRSFSNPTIPSGAAGGKTSSREVPSYQGDAYGLEAVYSMMALLSSLMRIVASPVVTSQLLHPSLQMMHPTLTTWMTLTQFHQHLAYPGRHQKI